jgi:hypothetical protein
MIITPEAHMHSACRVVAFCGLLLSPGVAQDQSPTASQVAAFESFAGQPGARIAWSREIARIGADEVRAVVTALAVEDSSGRRMRGIRIDLSQPDLQDRVYVAEEFLGRLLGAMDDVSAGMERLSRSPFPSRCVGSGAFLSALRQGAHVFHASQCAMADGWFGLSVETGTASFRFTDLGPAPFAAAFARSREELKDRVSAGQP